MEDKNVIDKNVTDDQGKKRITEAYPQLTHLLELAEMDLKNNYYKYAK